MSRSLILLLPVLALVAGCDKPLPARSQVVPVSPSPAVPPASGAVDRSHRGTLAATAAFVDAKGQRVTIADFRGKPVLVNLWATWCAPCVAEMPQIDALAARGDVAVVAVAQDFDDAKPVAFFAGHAFRALRLYRDDQAALSFGYGVNLPTSFLFDARGNEVWRTSGPRDWSSAETKALLAEAR